MFRWVDVETSQITKPFIFSSIKGLFSAPSLILEECNL